MTTRFILVRHGQTDWNRGDERFRGRADLPLNETGHAQARKIAARLSKESIAAIYSSPLKRAIQTVQPLADLFKCEIRQHPGLLDLDFGALEGMTMDEARAAFSDVIEKWTNAPGHTKFPKGESFKAMRTRIMAMLDELVEKHPGETIAVATHKVVCGAMLGIVLGMDADSLWRIHQDNACINRFEKRDAWWVVTSMNDTSHL
ncbi:MAG: histidine phosphatase family protein [Chloroflexi bacterium]|nr:histidine phosphatase family protein [Chloroflexota bacterium]